MRTQRTASLDATLAAYLEGRVDLPMNFQSIDGGDFVKHMLASTRVFDEKKERYEWREGDQADHYMHAENYERIAGTMYGGGSLVR